MRLYLDSSALAKRYLKEKGTEAVLQRMAEASEVLLSILSVPETISALSRLKWERSLSENHYAQLKRELARDMESVILLDLTPSVIRQTIFCLEETRLKTLDALHVASAKEAKCDLFLTADQKQLAAAKSLGLPVASV